MLRPSDLLGAFDDIGRPLPPVKRAPSTISREIKRLGPYWQGYSPAPALYRALDARRQSREGARKLIPGSPLFDFVAAQLREGWSPLQIAGRLRAMDEADRPGTVSHETIYQALYALKRFGPRGELRRELLSALRQVWQNRWPRARGTDRRQGFVTEDIRIAERPEEVIGRLIPGHWAKRRARFRRCEASLESGAKGGPDQRRGKPLRRRHAG